MQAAQFPHRIATFMVVAVLLCLFVLGLGLAIVRAVMDQGEADRSVLLVSQKMAEQARSLESISTDYNHWTDAWQAVMARDWDWVAENYAVSAIRGDLLQGIILDGGPLTEPVSWVAGQDGDRPVDVFLERPAVAQLRQQFEWAEARGASTIWVVYAGPDGPQMLAVSRVRPMEDDRPVDGSVADWPLAIFMRTIDRDLLATFARDLELTDIRFAGSLPRIGPSLPLQGLDGMTRSGLVWQASRPGTDMVRAIWPLLVPVAVVFLGLALGAGWLARVSARALIAQESIAQHQARTDALTGLPNRLAFTEMMLALDQQRDGPVGLLLLDLNGFKQINDSLGHQAGDAVIAAFAGKLVQATGSAATIARIGGDEFVLLFSGAPDAHADLLTARCRAMGNAIEQAQLEPIIAGDRSLTVTAAQGLAIWDRPDVTSGDLIRMADMAMYHAKLRRQAALVLFDANLERQQRERQSIADALRSALENPAEFSIVYQPLVAATDGRLIRAEALARWASPTLGTVPPDKFVAVAEQTGQIVALGRLLLRKIIVDMARCPALQVSINLSPLQLMAPGFASELADILGGMGVAAGRVELELTEGLLVSSPELAAFQMDALHEMGFTIALDDFGTGFSSIGYLRQMPFDTLKIDRSFLAVWDQQPGQDVPPDSDLIRSIILLGHAIGKLVVCEGVETQSQAQRLAALGCDQLQGYFVDRPQPLAELVRRYPTLSPAPQAQSG